jgi:DNA-binding transcriptional ArsR family regulator
MSFERPSPDAALRLAKALSHPLRQRLLAAYMGKAASPSDVAAELEEPLGNVSYHTKRLLDDGWLKLVGTELRRGGTAHIYTATSVYEVYDSEWRRLPVHVRRALADRVAADIVLEASQAAASGALATDDVHESRVQLELDEKGWTEISALLLDTLAKVERIQADASARGGAVRPSRLALLHFEHRE